MSKSDDATHEYNFASTFQNPMSASSGVARRRIYDAHMSNDMDTAGSVPGMQYCLSRRSKDRING